MEAIKVQMSTCNSELDKCLEDTKKPWTKYLAMAEEKTNVPRKYIFLGEFICDACMEDQVYSRWSRLSRDYLMAAD